jgi:hypothetical protein
MTARTARTTTATSSQAIQGGGAARADLRCRDPADERGGVDVVVPDLAPVGVEQRLGVEPELGRVVAQEPLGVDVAAEDVEPLVLERLEVVGADTQGPGRILEGAALILACDP